MLIADCFTEQVVALQHTNSAETPSAERQHDVSGKSDAHVGILSIGQRLFTLRCFWSVILIRLATCRAHTHDHQFLFREIGEFYGNQENVFFLVSWLALSLLTQLPSSRCRSRIHLAAAACFQAAFGMTFRSCRAWIVSAVPRSVPMLPWVVCISASRSDALRRKCSRCRLRWSCMMHRNARMDNAVVSA